MGNGLSIGMLFVALLSGAAVAGLLYFRNRKHHYGKPLTAILFVIRMLMVAILVMLLFNPFFKQKVYSVEQPCIVLAHDNSASLALGKDSLFYKTEYLSQLNELRNGLKSGCQVDEYEFGQSVRDFVEVDFSDQLTDMSALLQMISRRYYKRNVGAVLLFSDGVYNRGFDPQLIAEKLPFTMHTVVLGDTVAYPDLSVKSVLYNKVVSLGSTYPVRVTIGARDMVGKNATVVLKEDGRVVERQNVEILSNHFTKDVDFMLEAHSVGVKQIEVEIAAPAEEEQLLNNVKRVFVEVVDRKFKLLCVACAPHPDLSAIRSVLNDNYEVDFAFGKEEIPDFSKYNLVILHQVPSVNFPVQALKTQLEKNTKTPLLFVVGPDSDFKGLNEVQHSFSVAKGSANTLLDLKAHVNPSFSTFTLNVKDKDIVNRFPPLSMPHAEITAMVSHDDLLLQDVLGVKSALPLLSFARDNRKMAFLFGTNVWRWRLFEYYQTKGHNVFEELFSKSLKYLLLDSDDGSAVFCEEEYHSNEPVIIRAELRNPSNELVTVPDMTVQIVNKQSGEMYEYAFAKREHDYVLNAGILPPGLYSYKVQASMGENAIMMNGSFSVVEEGIESLQLTADIERMRNLAALTGGKCYLATELPQLLEDLENDRRITSVEHQETRFEDLIHSHWIVFLLIALATVEWVLRKMFGSY